MASGSTVPGTGLATKPPAPSAWLASALKTLSSPSLPGGARLVVRRLEDRPLAAVELCFAISAEPGDPVLPGDLALGLALAAKGRRGGDAEDLRRRLEEAGARLELKVVSQDALALELVAPPAGIASLAAAILDAVADPAFAAEGFPQAQFDAVMRDFRLKRLRDEGDPLFRAGTALKEGPYRGHPYSVAALGSPASLLALDRAKLAALWPARLASSRIVVSAVGDLDAAVLAAALTPALTRIAALSGAATAPGDKASPVPLPAKPAPLPVSSGIWTAPSPGASAAWLRADFSSPAMGEDDYAALLVALAMLDDVMMEELRPNATLSAGATASGGAYAAYSRLNPDAAPSGSVFVTRAASAKEAKAAVERSAALVASGLCLSVTDGSLGRLEANLEAYKARTLARLYSKVDGSAELALRVARDLASGGDGSAWFRLADKVAAVKAADVARVAKERLVEGPVAWAVAAPPAMLSGLVPAQDRR